MYVVIKDYCAHAHGTHTVTHMYTFHNYIQSVSLKGYRYSPPPPRPPPLQTLTGQNHLQSQEC